ncbi:MAG: hypothetical protein JNK05_23560 [Myxococcales bacterium]|nr:hypothetical protein [Myxococcales bacterium]
MRVGVISEGRSDFAVLRNVVKAVAGLDRSDVDSIRPDLQVDETTRFAMAERNFSNWQIVKRECEERESIRLYLENELDEDRLVIVHLDTAECDDPSYGVARPSRDSSEYVDSCAAAVSDAIASWVGVELEARVVAAVAVEETEAWLLAYYDTNERADTGRVRDPKAAFDRKKSKWEPASLRKTTRHDSLETYDEWSAPLRKVKNLRDAAKRNASLHRFAEALSSSVDTLAPGTSRW